MKKVFTNFFLLAALLVSGVVSAQVFFTEEFATGIPTGWTTTDGSNQGALWQYCADPAGTCVDYYTNDPFASTSAANGAMVMNSDSVLTAAGEPGDLPTNHLSRLTSTAISCTGKPKVFLLFQSFIGEFNAGAQARVRVSNDGTNWTPFDLPAYNNPPGVRFSENPLDVAINISSVAANKPTVFIEWEFEGNWEYWWWLDDVKLTTVDPTPAVNMKLSSFFYPLTHYQTPDFAISKDTFGFSCNVNNAGGIDQTQLIVKAWVTDESDGSILFQDSLITAGLAAGVDSQFVLNKRFAPELPVGDYAVHYRCYVPGSPDATPTDNVSKTIFKVSDGLWALENGATTSYQPSGVASDWAVANVFYMLGGTNEKYHIQDVEWRAGKTGGLDGFTAQIYVLEVNDAIVGPDWADFDDSQLLSPSCNWIGELTYNYEDTTSGNFPTIRYPVNAFPDGYVGVNIEQGKRYIVAVSWEGTNINLFHGFAENIPYGGQVNTLIYNGTWFLGGFGELITGVIRVHTALGEAGSVGVKDNNPLPESVLTVFPNPTSDQLNLDLNFDKPTSVTITLADIKGGVITVQDKEGVTKETVSFNLGGYAAGTYIARIATPAGTKTKEFVVVR